jgi:hypothetical protein
MLTAKESWEIVKENLIPELAELEVKIKSAAKKGFSFIVLREGYWDIKNRDYARTNSLIRIVKEAGYNIEYVGTQKETTIISW